MDQVNELMKLIVDAKEAGLMVSAVMVSFCARLVQPIKDRVHPGYEFVDDTVPTKEDSRCVAVEEVHA